MHHHRRGRMFFVLLVVFMVILVMPMFSATSKPLLFSMESAQSLELHVIPAFCDTHAEYTFTYLPQKKIEVHDWVLLHFPAGTKLEPPLPEDRQESVNRRMKIIEAITVRPLFGEDLCFTGDCAGLPIVTINADQSVDIQFNLISTIDPTQEKWKKARIIVNPEAGIVTPSKPGDYFFGLRSKVELKMRESFPCSLKKFGL
jgi:hypothetical protein